MTTKLKVFNKTLIKLGSETISAITDDSKSVRLINEIYDDIVKEELQKHNWIFAKKKATIYNDALLTMINSFKDCVTEDANIQKVGTNTFGIIAKAAGEAGNNIILRSTNRNAVLSGPTLTGGASSGGSMTAATGEITFVGNLNKGDVITIGTTDLVAGTDFSVGTEIEGFFKRKFDLPTDLLLLLEIDGFNALSTFPYQYGAYKQYDIIGRNIYCNKDILSIEYTASVEEDKFDSNFVNAVCCRICYELAEVLTQDDQKKQTWMNEYLLAIRDAKRVNAIQLPNASLGSGVLERVRVW